MNRQEIARRESAIRHQTPEEVAARKEKLLRQAEHCLAKRRRLMPPIRKPQYDSVFGDGVEWLDTL